MRCLRVLDATVEIISPSGATRFPWRVEAAEQRLQAAAVNGANAAAAAIVLQGARGFGHNDFKIPLVRRTLRAVLAES